MKKNILSIFGLTILVVLLCIGLSSCSKDDKGNDETVENLTVDGKTPNILENSGNCNTIDDKLYMWLDFDNDFTIWFQYYDDFVDLTNGRDITKFVSFNGTSWDLGDPLQSGTVILKENKKYEGLLIQFNNAVGIDMNGVKHTVNGTILWKFKMEAGMIM